LTTDIAMRCRVLEKRRDVRRDLRKSVWRFLEDAFDSLQCEVASRLAEKGQRLAARPIRRIAQSQHHRVLQDSRRSGTGFGALKTQHICSTDHFLVEISGCVRKCQDGFTGTADLYVVFDLRF
jgi:UTP-glucose-1-phosphate uridylyltransferase